VQFFLFFSGNIFDNGRKRSTKAASRQDSMSVDKKRPPRFGVFDPEAPTKVAHLLLYDL
jgi:hypothetical protein